MFVAALYFILSFPLSISNMWAGAVQQEKMSLLSTLKEQIMILQQEKL